MGNISDHLYRKASINKIPLNGTFELTPICNFACKMCYLRKTKKQIEKEGKQLIDYTQWIELAKKCKEEGMLYLLLTGGEPFLYPNFKELYEALHEMGFLIYINTNGAVIDEETVRWLRKFPPARINITLYGACKETYERITGSIDGYERVDQAINMLKEAGIALMLNASMIPENAEDLEGIFAYGKEHGIGVRMATYMFPPVRRDQEDSDSRFTPEETAKIYIRKVKCQLSEESCTAFWENQINSTEDDPIQDWGRDVDHMTCRAGKSTFWVSWEGEMTACGIVPFPHAVYPFLREFKECWQELTEAVRQAKVLKGCVGCEKRKVCNPCVAMIYSETGDANQKSEYLCQIAQNTILEMKRELTGSTKRE